MNVNRVFSPNSPVVMEQYEFMARDIVVPQRGISNEQVEVSDGDSGTHFSGGGKLHTLR